MKRFFVLGSGIKYSLSPAIFKLLFEHFDIDGEYTVKDIGQAELSKLGEIALGYDGFNVTKPFKTEIIKYLHRDLSGYHSVNTVTTRDMTGYSTDGDGFIFDLKRNFPYAANSSVLVLGYGGAALACVNALLRSGAEVFVGGRNAQKVQKFATENKAIPYSGQKVDGIVSCCTGTYVPKLNFTPKFCYDIRYAGEKLELGKKCANGMGMLIAQAIYSFGIFLGMRFDNSDVDRLYLYIKERL